jgi:hypothetical protein
LYIIIIVSSITLHAEQRRSLFEMLNPISTTSCTRRVCLFLLLLLLLLLLSSICCYLF